MTQVGVTPHKKLIEVALPLDAINRGAEDDKNRKTGHIRNLHKWFAPMPLPSWRAMLFASLIDDPGEHLPAGEAEIERDRLLRLVASLATFESHNDRAVLDAARSEITRALGGDLPLVVDPFCGGGSTILEAQRLGLRTSASDLNPVPVLITTMLCRVATLFAQQAPVHPGERQGALGTWAGLAGFRDDIHHYATVVREHAWEKLKSHYPPTHGGAGTPFAYRWAWTVASPDPATQRVHTPLITDWWLSKRGNSKSYAAPAISDGVVQFSIETEGEAPPSTTGRQGAKCLLTGSPIALDYIRREGREGHLGRAMFAVASRVGTSVAYSVPDETQLQAADRVPDPDIAGIAMPTAALGFRVQQYGIQNFVDLFTRRQSYSLSVFADCVSEVHDSIWQAAIARGLADDGIALEDGGSGARAYADAVGAFLGLCVSKMAQSNCILVRWFVDPRSGGGKATPAFDRHAVPMVWDFVETNPFGGSVGDWTGPVLETALRALDLCSIDGFPADVAQRDARDVSEALQGSVMIATDPPYYANIGYADLSDFFYLWLRRSLRKQFPRLLATVSTPKVDELIASPHRHAGGMSEADDYFRGGFTDVFRSLLKRQDGRFPMLIVYAIKQGDVSEGAGTGWEVFLRGLIDAGMSIAATWPVRTTTKTRMISFGTNSLGSAVFVIGRPRAADAPVITRREFIEELRDELPGAVRQLQRANIAPVDLTQAAIGPGMAIFTRYQRVLNSDGSPVSVKDALDLINGALDDALDGDFDADTRWALAWLEEQGFAEGEYGAAEQLSKAKNTSVDGMKAAGFLASSRGKVRLLKPAELPADWDPTTDPRLTVWEMTHHLIRTLESGGERAAGALVAKLGTKAEVARVLADRLYVVSERKKRAVDAMAYNGLGQSWPEIVRLAREQGGGGDPAQGALALGGT